MRTLAPLCAALTVSLLARPAPAQELTRPPELLEAAQAEYPEGLDGDADVKVRIHIDAAGAVTTVELPEPTGQAFDEAARAAAQRYRFRPAELDGKPGPIVIETVIHFRRALPPEPPPEPEAAPAPAGTAVLEGTVKERGTRRLLAGVTVVVGGLEREAQTDAQGRFRLAELPAGAHRVIALGSGFTRFTETVNLADGETGEIVVYLRPTGGSPYETVVEGQRERLEVTRRTMSRRELTTVPGTFGDPVRVIQNLPGLARAPFATGLLLVRGSDPNDTGVYVDGHAVPLLFHFLGGPSILNPEFLDSIDLYPGGFPARYGRVHGGVVEVNTRSPASDGVHGSAKIDVIDSGAYLRAPLGKHVTVAVAGRRSYVDALLPFILPEPDPGDTLVVVPVYWDYQARMDVELPRGQALSVLAFGSDDKLDLLSRSAEEMEELDLDTHIGFHRVRATFTTPLGGGLKFSLSPVYGRDVLSLSAGEQTSTDVRNAVLGLRERVWGKVRPRLHVDAGFDLDYRVTDFTANIGLDEDIRDPMAQVDLPPELVARSIDMYGLGLYGEVAWDAGRGVRLIPGVRGDVYFLNGKPRASVDPRVVLRWQALAATALKTYVGLYHEAPPPEGLDNLFGNPDLGLERALHTGLGVEQGLGRHVTLEVEGYGIVRDDLARFTRDVVRREDGTFDRVSFDNQARGHTIGLEVLLKHKVTERFYGWLSYTLSRSRIQRNDEDIVSPTIWDQTHNLIAVASYRLKSGWEFGARLRFSTGRPETPVTGATFDADADRYVSQRDDRNSARRPNFTELNLRVDKTWTFDTWQFGAYLDVINVTNAENPEATQFDYRYRDTAPVRGVPIVPTLGVKGQW